MDLSATIHLLGEALGEVLRTQESPELFKTEERVRALAKARRLGDETAGEHLAAAVAVLSGDAARAARSPAPTCARSPGVFSWMQSRFNLPGWYGLGSSLRTVDPALLDGDPVIQRSVHLRNPYVDPLNYL